MKDKTFILGLCLLIIVTIAGIIVWVSFDKEDNKYNLVNETLFWSSNYSLLMDFNDSSNIIISKDFCSEIECKSKYGNNTICFDYKELGK